MEILETKGNKLRQNTSNRRPRDKNFFKNKAKEGGDSVIDLVV